MSVYTSLEAAALQPTYPRTSQKPAATSASTESPVLPGQPGTAIEFSKQIKCVMLHSLREYRQKGGSTANSNKSATQAETVDLPPVVASTLSASVSSNLASMPFWPPLGQLTVHVGQIGI